MRVTIFPSNVQGSIEAPASKSSMQRLCAGALLHHGTTILSNPGNSNDDLSAIRVIQQLGAIVTREKNEMIINSGGVNPGINVINCGESGLGIRMFSPIIALSSQSVYIKGEGTLNSRPMDFFDSVLPSLGVTIQSNNGRLPIYLKGPMVPKNITIDGSLSSQFLSGMLFAYAYACKTPTRIEVIDLVSKPYIDLTLDVLNTFGYQIVNYDYRYFEIIPVKPNSRPLKINVEGDWSGAAFLLVAGAISGAITVTGLQNDSTQADRAVLNAFQLAGVAVNIEASSVSVKKSHLNSFKFDATDCPDLFPPLVALAAFCNGTTQISGISRLRHKESDRAQSLQQEFGKLGINIDLNGDNMFITGGSDIVNALVNSHHDHRIAMACAVTALCSKSQVTIDDAEAIDKSYPDFYSHLNQLGVHLIYNGKS